MDGSNGGSNSNSNSPAPFLLKTYEMVDDLMTDSIVSWGLTGRSFVVWNPQEFASDLLPKYFKHSNFSSFIRQLNTYGFRKIDPDQWQFANEEFIRGHTHLLKNIHRRKPIHTHSASNPLTTSEADEFRKDIEKLKQENLSLQSEVERHKQENQEHESALKSLHQTLQNIDHRQRRLILTVSQLLQKQALEVSESFSKKRRLLDLDYLNNDYEDDNLKQENENLTYSYDQNINNTSSLMIPMLNLGLVEKFNLSLNFWERFVDGVDQDPRDFDVSPEKVSSICIDLDCKVQMSLENDVDLSETKISNVEMSANRVIEGYFPSDANDIFWEQFLTEAPESFTARLGM